jgi:hypothetical protein
MALIYQASVKETSKKAEELVGLGKLEDFSPHREGIAPTRGFRDAARLLYEG